MPFDQHTKKKTASAIKVLLVIAVVIFIIWPPFYFAESIDADIVDASTKQPVVGANVVAIWILESGGLGGSHTTGVLKTKETVTDKNGHFHIGWWGPRIALSGMLVSNSPKFVIFNPQYYSRVLSNEGTSQRPMHLVQESDWDQKRIELKKITTLKERVSSAKYASSTLKIVLTQGHCLMWRDSQDAWLAIIKEQEALTEAGEDTGQIMNKANFLRSGLCGNPEKLFGEQS